MAAAASVASLLPMMKGSMGERAPGRWMVLRWETRRWRRLSPSGERMISNDVSAAWVMAGGGAVLKMNERLRLIVRSIHSREAATYPPDSPMAY